MNNNLKILATGMLALLAGCAQLTGTGCRDREVTVSYEAAYLKASPENVKICPGGTLTVRLAGPPVPAGSARTAPGPQNPGAAWLSGRNSDPDQIVLVVDEEEAEEGRTYKYTITIDEIGTLDPRVTVARY